VLPLFVALWERLSSRDSAAGAGPALAKSAHLGRKPLPPFIAGRVAQQARPASCKLFKYGKIHGAYQLQNPDAACNAFGC